MGKFSNIYHNLVRGLKASNLKTPEVGDRMSLEYQTALSSHTMSCVENAQSIFDSIVQIDKLNEEYVDDSSSDIFGESGGDDGNGGSGTEGGNGGGSDYFRPDELAKGRFVKNIEYTYRGMDLRPSRFRSNEPTRSDLYQNMEKKRILDTLESIRVPIPNKLQLCDYVNKQYFSDSCAGVYRHNLLGGGLLNDGGWEL